MVVRLPNQPSNKQKHVACFQQTMADGRVRERNLLPSEKMLDGEVRFQTMELTATASVPLLPRLSLHSLEAHCIRRNNAPLSACLSPRARRSHKLRRCVAASKSLAARSQRCQTAKSPQRSILTSTRCWSGTK
eukprot:7035330-Prymnesium_polylepis.1